MIRQETMGVRMWALRSVHVVWGFPQNALGAALSMGIILAHRRRGCTLRTFRTALVTEWALDAGLSMGLFVFVPQGCPRALVVHEYGHCVQSLALGPLYLPLVVVPSLIWAGLPVFERIRGGRGISYYDMPVERWANVLGERVCGEPAPR